MMARILVFALLVHLLSLGYSLSSPHVVSAQLPRDCGSSSFLGLPTWHKYLQVAEDDTGRCTVTGPTKKDPASDRENFDWEAGLGRIALAIVEIMLRIVGLVAVGYVIYGGIKYILSQGEPDKTKSAKNTVVNALIGAAIAIAATAIVNLIGGALM